MKANATEFTALFEYALIYAKHIFKKRLLPFIDVEDVAIESAEKTLMLDECGAFKHAANREERRKFMRIRLEALIRNAAKTRRTQRAMTDIGAFDRHLNESERFDEDGGDREVEESWLTSRERMESDCGAGALRIQTIADSSTPLLWPRFFNATERRITERARTEDEKDAREELKRLKRRIGISSTKPRYLKAERRERAQHNLRQAFRPAQMLYHRERIAEERRA